MAQKQHVTLIASAFLLLSLLQLITAQEQCGRAVAGKVCPNKMCCSQYGFCGTTPAYCGAGCQSQCGGSTPTPTPATPSPTTGGTGKASFYTPPYMPSSCFGNDPAQFPANMYFAAAGNSATANLWNDRKNCGKMFKITCVGTGCTGGGPITIKVVDLCPDGCSGGRAFDLSAEAFRAIANPDVGVITINYAPA